MRLSRFNQIKAMTVKRPKNAPVNQPQGYGYGAWHQALWDLAFDICADPAGEKKFNELETTIGTKLRGSGTTQTFKISELIHDELSPSHLATAPTQEEWQAIIKKVLPLMKEPKPDSPEVAAVEKEADKLAKDLAASNQRNAELEEALAKARSAQAN